MEPDVEQDLDWSVDGKQSKTVVDLKCFSFSFSLGSDVSLIMDQIHHTESSLVLLWFNLL